MIANASGKTREGRSRVGGQRPSDRAVWRPAQLSKYRGSQRRARPRRCGDRRRPRRSRRARTAQSGGRVACPRRHADAARRTGRARHCQRALLADLLARWHASRAYVELVNARPGEGAVGAFSFGRSRGLVEGVLAAFNVPLRFLTPPTWKRVLGLPTGRPGTKDAARSEAIRRWPARAVLFGRVKDDGRAEAALIAVAGMLRGQR